MGHFKTTVITLCAVMLAIASKAGSDSGRVYFRFQIKALEYSMAALNQNFAGANAGVRFEALMADGAIIPEVHYHTSYVNAVNLLSPDANVKGFLSFKAGLRIGIPGDFSFRNLRCIDRVVTSGKYQTTYYENDRVRGRGNFGLNLGFMNYRTTVRPYTKTSGYQQTTVFNAQNLYAGVGRTKYIANSSKKYGSGNTCTWDKYDQWYVSYMYAINHTLGDDTDAADLNQNAGHLRSLQRGGFVLGYENGRMLKGFVATFEMGALPSLKGRGGFFNIGMCYAIGF